MWTCQNNIFCHATFLVHNFVIIFKIDYGNETHFIITNKIIKCKNESTINWLLIWQQSFIRMSLDDDQYICSIQNNIDKSISSLYNWTGQLNVDVIKSFHSVQNVNLIKNTNSFQKIDFLFMMDVMAMDSKISIYI